MKHLSFILILILLSFKVYAASDDTATKKFTLGLGMYSSFVNYDTSVPDDRLSGASLSFGYAISDQIALRATYFSLAHKDNSNLESAGYDLLGYFGTGLESQGFKAYIGGGLFRDKWTLNSADNTFSGLQLSGGLGYSWKSVAVDFILNYRDSGDYEDFVNQGSPVSAKAVAGSGNLLVSYRF